MRNWDLADASMEAAELFSHPPTTELGAGTQNQAARSRIANLTADALVASGAPVRNRKFAECCLAGLWLLHNFLDEAHAIVQAIDDPEASYWHAIVHRREGDYSNAKYWNRQAGMLPIFADFVGYVEAADFLPKGVAAAVVDRSGHWQPDAWVDAYRAVKEQRPPLHDAAAVHGVAQLQHAEWQLLLENCWQQAFGPGKRASG